MAGVKQGVDYTLRCARTKAADKRKGEVGVQASVIKPTCVHQAPFLHQAKNVQDGSIWFVAWVCLIICNDKGWIHWGHSLTYILVDLGKAITAEESGGSCSSECIITIVIYCNTGLAPTVSFTL